jgi:HNH endonuclease
LRGLRPKTCRFCGRSEPTATFDSVAHAIPESIGNKTLVSEYECDECNQMFGDGIETEFGKWSKPMRVYARIRGKKHWPEMGEAGGWEALSDATGLKLKSYEAAPIVIINELEKTLDVTVVRDPYVPSAVIKAFVKMALTLMPEDELVNFAAALNWIRQPVAGPSIDNVPLLATLVATDRPFKGGISLFLYRRRFDSTPVFYSIFVLAYGNEVFQVEVPSPERDLHLIDGAMYVNYVPTPFDADPSLGVETKQRAIDLTSGDRVAGEKFQVRFKYGGGQVTDLRDNSVRTI